jgi:hypothetical protein
MYQSLHITPGSRIYDVCLINYGGYTLKRIPSPKNETTNTVTSSILIGSRNQCFADLADVPKVQL